MKIVNKVKLTNNKVHFENVTTRVLTIEEFLDLPPVPMQRNTEERAKQSKVKKMLRTLKPTHLEVAIVELKKDCKYYDTVYKKGTKYIANGNTRKLFWLNNLSDAIPANVNATVYQVNDMEEVRDIYNMYDNPDTSEIGRAHV